MKILNNFYKILSNVSFDTLMKLVQSSILREYLTNNPTEYTRPILEKYKHYIFPNLYEPSSDIIQKAQTMGTKTEIIKNNTKGPRVFLHTLQNLNRGDKTEYNAVAIFFSVEYIRIYDLSLGALKVINTPPKFGEHNLSVVGK